MQRKMRGTKRDENKHEWWAGLTWSRSSCRPGGYEVDAPPAPHVPEADGPVLGAAHEHHPAPRVQGQDLACKTQIRLQTHTVVKCNNRTCLVLFTTDGSTMKFFYFIILKLFIGYHFIF